ncbi:MAG: hypothetical protein KatS3mg031_0364 [Chitinophagales bacterium]|nr:MAG: hypothetical protein KatS3mg031_0364 [Chitinophagales bacterium]
MPARSLKQPPTQRAQSVVFYETQPNGIATQTIHLLKIYPNPVTDFFEIQHLGNDVFRKYTITNMLGQNVQSGSVITNNTVNVAMLKPGIYLLTLNSDNGILGKGIFLK